jgi:hypothetical protein
VNGDDRIPDVIGEVVGWRAWKVVGGLTFPLLASVTHAGTVWHPDRWTLGTCNGDLECRRRAENPDAYVPGEHCSCGLYAASTRAQLVKLGYAKPGSGELVKFIGEVGLAGKVIAGTQGWRAEKGRIVRLYVPFHDWRFVDPLEALYRVPVVLENTLRVPNRTEGS